MDFRSLSRRELQALCKKNKIPANITNVAMADALAALPSVEGIEEFLNGEGSGVPESPMKEEFANSENPRTALRTSTRRTVKDEPITTRTRREAAAKCTEESGNRDLNVALTTPSLPSSRRRSAAAASSACKKVDFKMTDDVAEKEDDDLDQEKTPAVPKSQKRVAAASTRRTTATRTNGAAEQRGYSTRRSVRLLEATMESLSLGEDKKMEPITVDMSFDEMPNRIETGAAPVKEDINSEIESKKTDELESKLDDDLELETDNQEKNELEAEVKVSEVEPEMDIDSLTSSAENLVTGKSCDNSETEALDNNMNVKCSPEVEGANEASKDDNVVDLTEVQPNESTCESEDPEVEEANEASRDDNDVDLTEVEPNESTCESEDTEEESKIMNISAEISLPHEEETEAQIDNVQSSVEESAIEAEDDVSEMEEESLGADTETQIDNVQSSVEESAIEAEDDVSELEEESSGADIEGDNKEMEMMEMVSIQAEEDDSVNSKNFPENVSEELVDVKIQWQMEEEAPKEAVVEVSVISTEEININGVQSIPSFASQFPRPNVEPKSPHKVQSFKLLIDNSDVEDEEEKEQEQANCIIQKQTDLSLRQLKKMFKEKLQLNNKKKMDNNNNTKVGGEGKVRTALQPLSDNRMAMD